ncbi:MAG: M23 family metallopeptidase [Fischerella sp.]|nr:M23 family metallopeptidase [Fischerella sp.]
MTQRNHSAPNRLHHSWQRTLPAQSICWLGSFSLLSSGLVLAQTESPIDNIVPTVENSQPAAGNIVKKEVVERSYATPTTEVANSQPEFSQRRTKLRQRLWKAKISQSPAEKRQSQPETEASQSVVISASTETVRNSTPNHAPVIIRERKPQVEYTAPTKPISIPNKLPEVAQPANNSSSTASATAAQTKDYNNAYIDPTDYNPAAKYEAPSSVVITERSTGCKAVLAQGVSSTICGRNQSVANAKTRTPSWLRKSQNARLAAVTPTKRIATNNESNTGWRPPRLISKVIANANRVANVGVTKSTYRSNRYIPDPSSFTPTTTVSSAPIAPSGGTLPPPMTADNFTPRPSVVAYNIPLATTLPRIAYSTMYGGRVAIGSTGLAFPLTVPAPITSLFGWRTHPITGNRRFHSGMDLGAAMGTPILAAYSGQVETADWQGGYGLAVILNHNNALQTLYGHMSEIFVQPGQWVERGNVIGRVGSTGNSTGPHLHFEVRQLTPQGWVATDPVLPLQSALNQMVQTSQTAQVNPEPGS